MKELVAMAHWSAGILWALALLATAAELLDGRRARFWRLGAQGLLAGGCGVLIGLTALLWSDLGRPPLRTLGETRLWYALLLPVIGLLVELRLRTSILRVPMILFGILFVSINIAKPDTLDRTLMPALQSPWFIPHVVLYMVSYAALGLSCGAAVWVLIQAAWKRRAPAANEVHLAVLLMRIGLPFLTLGLLVGALWAKEAWGHYWTWDPKETWAFLTWAVYLGLLHTVNESRVSPRLYLGGIAVAFLVVLGCWFLVNYLPAAQVSVHAYT